MKTFAQRDNYFCVLLDKPEELDIYAAISNVCYIDKVVNPSVDDEGAADVVRRARNEGIDFWRNRYEAPDYWPFVLFRKNGDGADAIGVTSVILPEEENVMQCPLMCSAHILSGEREQGLAHLLVDASLKFISQETTYNDVHVLAKKDNAASKAALTKRGFYILKRGEKYDRFIGRIPMMQPRLTAKQPSLL